MNLVGTRQSDARGPLISVEFDPSVAIPTGTSKVQEHVADRR